jgi:Tc5 transposase DNA-binding domain
LISAWVQEESKWRKEWSEAQSSSERERKRIRLVENPQATEMLEMWISKAMNDKVLVTGEVLRAKYRQFEEMLGIPEEQRLKLSAGWLESLKNRAGLKSYKRHGEAGSTLLEDANAERERVKKLIQDLRYAPGDTFNMDETGLFWA